MKKTLTCPKCDGRKILHMERVLLPSYASGFNAGVASLPLTVQKGTLNVLKPVGGFEAFICRACGFTEWYADGAAEVEPDEKAGIHVIDNEPKATLR